MINVAYLHDDYFIFFRIYITMLWLEKISYSMFYKTGNIQYLVKPYEKNVISFLTRLNNSKYRGSTGLKQCAECLKQLNNIIKLDLELDFPRIHVVLYEDHICLEVKQ